MKKEEQISEARKAFEEYKLEKKRIIAEDSKLEGIESINKNHKLMKSLLKAITRLSGEKITFLNNRVNVPKGRTIIYANTHRFKPDCEKLDMTGEASSVIASDFINAYKKISGWYFSTRKAVFVDPYDKEDRNNSSLLMKKIIQTGVNFTIFPEAVWNFSENLLVLDIFEGTAKNSLETNAVIVPSAIERYGKTFVINRNGYLDPIEFVKRYTCIPFNKLDKDLQKKIISDFTIEIRDYMATLLLEIYIDHAEKHGIEKRSSISDAYWEKFLEGLMKEWPGYDINANINEQYHNKDKMLQQQVESDLQNMYNNHMNENNAFMAMSNSEFQYYMSMETDEEKRAYVKSLGICSQKRR